MSKMTPGPWRWWPDTLSGLVSDKVGNHIACMAPMNKEANANLIAAAPDLLEVADAVLEWARAPGEHGGNPYCKEFVRLAEKAKAKAEGGTSC